MSDLPAKPTAPSARALSERYEDAESVLAVLSSRAWRGPWEPPERMRVSSVLGSVVLDYRDADLPPGVTAVDCHVYLGSVEVVVPADVDVEVTGSVFLGSVETTEDTERPLRLRRPGTPHAEPEPADDDERPLLSVHCSGVMGSVEVRLD